MGGGGGGTIEHDYRSGPPSAETKSKLTSNHEPLTSADKSVIDAYSSTRYGAINGTAMQNPKRRVADNPEIMFPSNGDMMGTRNMNQLTAALDKTELPIGVIASHRTAWGREMIESAGLPFDEGMIGATITNRAFTSTALAPGVHKGNTLFEIEVPAGSKATYIQPYSRHSGEYEVLLQRGAKMEITGFKPEGVSPDGKWQPPTVSAKVTGFVPIEELDTPW